MLPRGARPASIRTWRSDTSETCFSYSNITARQFSSARLIRCLRQFDGLSHGPVRRLSVSPTKDVRLTGLASRRNVPSFAFPHHTLHHSPTFTWSLWHLLESWHRHLASACRTKS